MNKIIKWICLGSCAVLACGIVLVIGGKLLGGKLRWAVSFADNQVVSVDDGNLVSDSMDLDAFSAIDVNSRSVDLIIEKGDGYSIEYQTLDINIPTINVKDGILNVDVPESVQVAMIAVNDLYEYIKITVPDNSDIYDVTLQSSSGDVNVEEINISGTAKIASGEMTIKNSQAGRDLYVNVASGEVILENIKVDNLSLDVLSGDYSLTDIEASSIDYKASSGCASFINVKTGSWKSNGSSGSIDVSNIVTDTLTHEATSGDFSLEDAVVGSIDIDITSGDVDVDSISVNNVKLHALSGSIEMQIKGAQNDYGYELKAASGDINCGTINAGRSAVIDSDKDKIIEVDIASGDVDIEFDN